MLFGGFLPPTEKETSNCFKLPMKKKILGEAYWRAFKSSIIFVSSHPEFRTK